jgi:hypothetical protein
MPITKKELITEHYLILINALEEFIDKSLFPSLDEFIIIDVVSLLNLFFPKDQTEEEYINTIKFLIIQKEIVISDAHLPIVINLIIDFINFLNNI